jgi:hypothetical protein
MAALPPELKDISKRAYYHVERSRLLEQRQHAATVDVRRREGL